MRERQKEENTCTGISSTGTMELKFLKERNAFREKLGPFPHLFQLEDYGRLSAAKLPDIRDRLQRERGERAVDNIPDVERHRDSNFIAFIAFLLDDLEEAKRETEAVLKDNPHNLVACGNLAVFTWEKLGSEIDTEKILMDLQHLQRDISFNQRRREATAEMAYCYSRMGPKYLELARQTFLTVVEEMPENYDAKLSLAMVLRRSAHMTSRICLRIHAKESGRRKADAEKLLRCIIDAPAATRLVKAQAAAELGTAIFRRCKKFRPAETAFEEAIRIAPKEPIVLVHAAKFFRTVRGGSRYTEQNLNRSRQLLEEALKITPTTTAHHSLGLTFRKLAEADLQKNRNRKRKLDDSAKFTARLSRNDANVEAADLHLRQAIQISHDQNTSARIDLAKLLIDLGEEAEGITLLQSLLGQETFLRSPMDFIRAHELAGMFKLSKSRTENNQRREKELEEDGRKLLHIALKKTAEVSFSSREIRKSDSYQALLYDLQSYASKSDKLKMEAAIHYAGQDYLRVLHISELLDDTESNEMRLACYVKLGMFQQAMSFLTHRDADGRELTTDNWTNPQLPVQVCILAMREQLRFGCTSWEAKTCCLKAFQLRLLQQEQEMIHHADRDKNEREMQPSYSNMSDDEEFHVTIIHDKNDPSVELKVTRLTSVLRDVCGLRVFCRDDGHPGKCEMSAVLDSVWRSETLVVFIGDRAESPEFLQLLLRPSLYVEVEPDSRCRDVVVVRAGNDLKLMPRELRGSGYRQWKRMSTLLDPLEPDRIGKAQADCICDLICFLLGTNIDNLSAEKQKTQPKCKRSS